MANRITTLIDFRQEGRGLSKIKADIQGVDGAWNKAKTGFKSAMDEFKQSGAAQAAVAAAVVKIGIDSVKAASNLEESANAVATTFDEASDDIGRLAEDSVNKYGLSERAFNELAVAFSGFAQQVVGEGGDVAGTIDTMATRVADFASVHNLDMADAMIKFQSALAGETEAVRRYGIDVSAAAVETYAYANGIAESGEKLTEAQKVQARYGLLLQETSQWQGDFAATSESLANQQRILQANIENLQAELGNHLIPALSESTSQLNELLDVAQKLKLIDLGAEFAKWANPNPVIQFREWRDLATETKFRLDEFEGSAEQLRAKLEELGFDQDEINKAVEFYAKTQTEATEATEGTTEAAGEQAEILGILTAQSAELERGTEDWTKAEEAATEAQEEAKKEAERLIETLETQRRRIDDLISAKTRLVGGEIAVRQAQRDARDAAAELDTVLKDQKSTLEDAAVAIDDAVVAQLDAAQAAVDYKTEQRLANGETVTAEDKNRLLIIELQNLATQLTGPLRDAILGHIAELEAIPKSIDTRVNVIRTGSGSAVQVDEHGNVRAVPGGDDGGVVPGPRGSPQLALLHGGETVVPTHKMPGSAQAQAMLGSRTVSGAPAQVRITHNYINQYIQTGGGSTANDIGRRTALFLKGQS